MEKSHARVLAEIRREVRRREHLVPLGVLKARCEEVGIARDATKALLEPGCTVIAEIKRSAPGRGTIANIPAPERLGMELQAGGAKLIACHTSRRGFHGSLKEMARVREAVSVPVLCRDIILGPYQIHEARCHGADMVPLRVGVLDQPTLEALIERVEQLGMAALVEVRTPQEASRALAAEAKIIGINARDFATMELNREAFSEIVPGLPSTTLKVALSGVRDASELLSYAASGADAVVVGERIVSSSSPREATRAMVAAGQHPACPSR